MLILNADVLVAKTPLEQYTYSPGANSRKTSMGLLLPKCLSRPLELRRAPIRSLSIR